MASGRWSGTDQDSDSAIASGAGMGTPASIAATSKVHLKVFPVRLRADALEIKKQPVA